MRHGLNDIAWYNNQYLLSAFDSCAFAGESTSTRENLYLTYMYTYSNSFSYINICGYRHGLILI